MSGNVSVYGRAGLGFVTHADQTVDGVWIGSGEVEVVDLTDTSRLGGVVIAALRRSRTGVPHPARDEWTAQRERALAPLVEAAGERTWRSFVRLASLVTVSARHGGATVHPWRHDERRHEVFVPDTERTIIDVDLAPAALGEAVGRALSADA